MAIVRITEPARGDIQESFERWKENRSATQATAWYEQVCIAIATLEGMPERCPIVPETGLSQGEVRHLLFGVGSRPTHRIIFHFDRDLDVVTDLRVWHTSQSEL